MALIYYAKLNLNSEIFKTQPYGGYISIKDELEKLYELINDSVEYESIGNTYVNKSTGNLSANKDIYNFSKLTKVNNEQECYISGSIVRRFPYYGEQYDENIKESKAVKYENHSSSIRFYFDVYKEIITFTIRNNFKQRQFVDAFKNLVNKCSKDREFEVFLINDPFTIKERLDKAYKITKIKSTVVAPNVNEDHFSDLEQIHDRKTQEMKDANVTKKTDILQISRRNSRSIKRESELVKRVLNETTYKMYEKGYGQLEVEGEYKDGSKFNLDSKKDAAYVSIIDDRYKNDTSYFEEESRRGIVIYLDKIKNRYKK